MRVFIACCIVLAVFICQPTIALAVDTTFTRGLTIRSGPGYPEAIVVHDPIAFALVQGTWAPPHEGETITYNDTVRGVWETMKADSAGWFEHPTLRHGYVYIQFDSPERRTFVLEAMGDAMVYVNGVPRSGNPYSYKDVWEPWETRFNYSLIPIQLEKGRNDLLFQCNRSRLKVKLWTPRMPVFWNSRDLTLPDLRAGKPFDMWGGIVAVNASTSALKDCAVESLLPSGEKTSCAVPVVQELSVRKIPFRLAGVAPSSPAPIPVRLTLRGHTQAGQAVFDTTTILLRVVTSRDTRKETFISSIDGSVQYYAINPASDSSSTRPVALFFSLHGAGVEAANQASSYYPKTWGNIVAPTNRRPYGFNWEDWGRLDALEVLQRVEAELNVDPGRIYLTGHSMGGHGVYHIGSLFPDRFAAIGPSAGWISFWTYRVREGFKNPSPMKQMLMRGTLPSDTYTMAANYAQLGVYILHGSKDDNVFPDQAHMMAEHLAKFDKDFVFHEQQGAGHWWDNSDEPGADCVDWPPMFDYFARHARPEPERLRTVEFSTPNPGISSHNNWIGIEAQTEQLKLSSVSIRFDPGMRRFVGSTSNVQRLSFDPSIIKSAGPVTIELDSQKVSSVVVPKGGERIWMERRQGLWAVTIQPSPSLKGPHRYGTFKDAFKNRMIFVYGTKGNKAENRWAFEKARYDAERFWYQGNGSIDVVADVEFNPKAEPDRNVILYGNGTTNVAWQPLLGQSPVQVSTGTVTVGSRRFTGEDLCCVFIRPRPGSTVASVGAISGAGLKGMRLTDRMPYLLPGTGLPDCVVIDSDVLANKETGMLATGIFGLDWTVDAGEFVWNK